ncbi:enolase C-terminal domain-like protein [Clavulina sp. PMI_390]|nr:enolase C-terminal domain-like protein [Clavulina sp. PMI_390]
MPGGPKIASIEIFRLPPRWLFVRVATAKSEEHTTEYVGWGEATLEGHTEAIEGAFNDLRERFIGADCDDIERIYVEGYRGRFYRGGPVLMSAISGLDIALWDIKGKRLGVPIYSLLGGKVRDRCAVYGWIGGDRPSDVVEGARKRKEQGFRAVKMNGSESMGWLDSPSALDATVERVKAVRELGLDVGVDFHGRVHLPMARQLARKLESVGPLFIEEPLLPTQPLEIADLAKQTTIPIALGERLFTRQDFRPYLEARAISIAQPDIAHCGGISELRRIASLAETYDVALAPHCPLGPIAFMASVQVGLASPNFVIQECSWEMHYNLESRIKADLLTYVQPSSLRAFAIKDGFVEAPLGPGIGFEVDEEKVRAMDLLQGTGAATRQEEVPAWRNPMFIGQDGALREW